MPNKCSDKQNSIKIIFVGTLLTEKLQVTKLHFYWISTLLEVTLWEEAVSQRQHLQLYFKKGLWAQVFSSEFFKRSIFSYRKPPWLLLNAVTTQNIWLYLQKNIILLRQICSVGKLKKPVLLYVNDKRSCFAFFVGLLDT